MTTSATEKLYYILNPTKYLFFRHLALLPQRIFKAVVMIPIQTVLIGLVWKNIVLKVDKSYGVMPNA